MVAVSFFETWWAQPRIKLQVPITQKTTVQIAAVTAASSPIGARRLGRGPVAAPWIQQWTFGHHNKREISLKYNRVLRFSRRWLWRVTSVESEQNFRRNTSPPSSGLKSKTTKKPEWGSACYLLHAGLFLGLFFDPEDGGNMFSETLLDFQRITRQKIEMFVRKDPAPWSY
jgi:hypothetical protein